MAEEKKGEGEKEAAPEGPKKIMGLPLPQFLFVAVNILTMLGATGYIVQVSLLYKKPPITETQMREEIAKKEEKKAVETGDDFKPIGYPEQLITLRSAQGGKIHYASVETSIVCGSEECETQVKSIKSKVEDAIQSVISSRSYTELGSLETKFRIKHEILSKVNAELEDTAAVDVLFSNFTVQ